ncbi:P-loop containing nucleoside triphosphate hydrolase protein [Violaceomyces palustris]|uniref:P-loop containing nucleoside triphosphate hydrolase protein n=1 Tax=Violaceomyces palustris TaxID=1673888 RepID=A0ACD0NMW7_9BASI|nr:P-loop containing nucleoside triphosphate hydrolase protein [Violaceomyces palustris]
MDGASSRFKSNPSEDVHSTTQQPQQGSDRGHRKNQSLDLGDLVSTIPGGVMPISNTSIANMSSIGGGIGGQDGLDDSGGDGSAKGKGAAVSARGFGQPLSDRVTNNIQPWDEPRKDGDRFPASSVDEADGGGREDGQQSHLLEDAGKEKEEIQSPKDEPALTSATDGRVQLEDKVDIPSKAESIKEGKPGPSDELVSKRGWKERLKLSSNYIALFRYSDRYDYLLIVVGIISAIGSGVPLPLIGMLFGDLIDEFNGVTCTRESGSDSSSYQGSFMSAVDDKVVKIAIVASVNFCLIWTYTCCWSYLGERLVRKMREKYLAAVLKQDMEFFDTMKPGEVGTRLSADLLTIQNGTSEKLGIMISAVSYFVTSYIVAFNKLPVLAAQLVSLLPAFGLVSFVGSKYVAKATKRTSDHLSHASSLASEALNNLTVVQAFGSQKRLSHIYQGHLELARRQGTRKALSAALVLGSLFFVGYSANSLAFFSGGRLIADSIKPGEASSGTVGSVYTVIFLLLDASFIVGQIAPYLQTFSAASGAGKAMMETIDKPSPIDGTSESEGIIPPPGNVDAVSLSFENVSFAYPSRPEALAANGMNLEVGAGQKVGIVGVSGSGKSTLAALAQRFYDPKEGSVKLNGIDIRQLNVRWLRSQIGVVGQEPVLFDCTIIQSIAHGLMGSPAHAYLGESLHAFCARGQDALQNQGDLGDLRQEERQRQNQEIRRLCIQAAKMAGAHDFIVKLPQGYDTPVGEAGGRISGGQKQRISIARAVVKQPRLLILDEATAALDSHSERAVTAALEQVSQGRTTLAIAHRLSTLRNYDKIVVVAEGQVVEQGTHKELMAKRGHYYRLAEAQDTSGRKTASDSDESDHDYDDEDEAIDNEGKRISDDELMASQELSREKAAGSKIRSEKEASTSTDEGTPVKGYPSSVVARKIGRLIRREWIFVIAGLFTSAIMGGSYSGEAVLFGHVIDALNPCRGKESVISHADMFARYFFILAVIQLFAYSLNGLMWGTVAERLIIAWRIAVVILATVPILLTAGFLRLKVLADFQRRHETAYVRSNALAIEAVSCIRTVAALGRERDVVKLFHRSLEQPYNESLRHYLIGNIFLAVALSISYFIYAFAYWWGSRNVAEGRYSQVAFFTVLPALLFSAQASGQLLAFAPDFSKAHVSAANIFKLMDQRKNGKTLETSDDDEESPERGALRIHGNSPALMEDVESRPASNSADSNAELKGPAAVEFKDAWFTYPTRSEPALRGISLQVAPGSFAAFVGQSGSGKTTAMALIENFYEPSSGAVLVDGRQTTKVDEAVLRSDIAIVPQEPVIFYGTVRFNVSLGMMPIAEDGEEEDDTAPWRSEEDPWQKVVSDEEIIEACKLAGIHETIMRLPDQYDTLIGSNQLSGGERQRLAIARALLRKPRLLLLDESTSALDAKSEQAFQVTLENIHKSKKCTIIAIAHRMRTIRDSSIIFCFSDGKVVAKGSYSQLMRTSPHFRAMVNLQSLQG